MKTTRLEISEATEADCQSISRILDEACRWLADKGIRQWTVPFGEDYIRKKIVAREFHMITLAGEPVGVFRLLWSDLTFWGDVPENAAYIHTLAVRREFAGRGIGKCAIEWAAGRARRQGKEYLRLDCMAASLPLRNYYERLGFSPVGDRNVRDFQVTLLQRPIINEELCFRKIAAGDVERLFEVRSSVHENRFSMDALAEQGITPRTVIESLGKSHDGYLCESAGRVAGFAMADLKAAELWVIAVLPEHEGRGIGRGLLRLTEALLWSAGHKSIWLWTSADRGTRAFGLYTSSGWAEGELKGHQLFMTKKSPDNGALAY